MLKAVFKKYILHFRRPSGTSRGVLTDKETYFIRVWDDAAPEISGIGECPLFRGLSAEDTPDYEVRLSHVCRHLPRITEADLMGLSSVRFGLEMALKDLENGGVRKMFPSPFVQGKEGIRINGLIWMGSESFMAEQIREKLKAGFTCIKLKIGAIDFETELSLLRSIRKRYPASEIELRVDANGAFSPSDALRKLEALSAFDLHSIEQPIRQGQWEDMARLCRNTPVPIALDEELIGIEGTSARTELLDFISPQYIILKPALCGGFSGAEEWIRLAKERKIGEWVTSALESDIGLNALAQWVSTMKVQMPQGLGTGRLYTNNVPSPLVQRGERLWYDPSSVWELDNVLSSPNIQ